MPTHTIIDTQDIQKVSNLVVDEKMNNTMVRMVTIEEVRMGFFSMNNFKSP